MITHFTKRFLPKSLFARTILIVLTPIILLEVSIGFVFIQRHYEQVATQMSSSVSIQLNYIIRTVENAADQESAETFAHEMGKNLGFSARLDKETKVFPKTEYKLLDFSGRAITEVFLNKISKNIQCDFVSNWRIVSLGIQTTKGALLINIRRDELASANPHQLLVLMVFLTILLMMFSLILLRNQIKPIVRLSKAAEAFGKGESIEYQPSGSVEVRGAGLAFLNMRERLQKQITQRTEMLSGISHDLKTPLTRLKLAISLMEGNKAEVDEIKNDVDMMDKMVREFLDFSKDQTLEQTKKYNVEQFYNKVSRIISSKYSSVRLTSHLESLGKKEFFLRPLSIERALQNVLDNALRYGSKVLIDLNVDPIDLSLNIEIHDDGPGIPEKFYDLALRPFSTLDHSRNQNEHAGAGLGLSISLDICTSHGGILSLHKSSKLSGLMVRMKFPSS